MRKLSYFVVLFLLSMSAIPKEKQSKNHFEQLELFNKVFHLIETQYYRNINTDTLIEGAIKGMLETLDPHSAFLSRDSFEKMQSDTSGEYGGIGIEVMQKDGVIYVVTPIEDTPAYKAGIKVGDKIVEIDHAPTIGFSLDQAIEKMKGKTGTKVTVGVARENEDGVKQIVVERQIIQVKPVKFQLIKDNYAFIRLVQFQKRSADSIADAMKKLLNNAKSKGGLKGIILDLRYNPGGLLDEAVSVASIFLKEGVVVSTEGRDPKQKDIRYVDKSIYKNTDLPLAVLINGASASASEIVAGALQDHGRAIIMGSRSFGKGSVQSVAKIGDDSGVKLTIAQYMTPKGRKIQALGIDPDIKLVGADIDVSNYEEENFIREKDLKNHLTATIETPEEKKLREEEDKAEREKRALRIKMKSEHSSDEKKDTELFKKYDPSSDYQVLQAVNYLESVKIVKKLTLKM